MIWRRLHVRRKKKESLDIDLKQTKSIWVGWLSLSYSFSPCVLSVSTDNLLGDWNQVKRFTESVAWCYVRFVSAGYCNVPFNEIPKKRKVYTISLADSQFSLNFVVPDRKEKTVYFPAGEQQAEDHFNSFPRGKYLKIFTSRLVKIRSMRREIISMSNCVAAKIHYTMWVRTRTESRKLS